MPKQSQKTINIAVSPRIHKRLLKEKKASGGIPLRTLVDQILDTGLDFRERNRNV